jgi:hypothetical protein
MLYQEPSLKLALKLWDLHKEPISIPREAEVTIELWVVPNLNLLGLGVTISP